jgi:hypothetical protein
MPLRDAFGLLPSPVATRFVRVPVVTEDVVLADPLLHAKLGQNPLRGSVAGVDDGQYALGSVIQRPGQTGCRGFGGIAVTARRACEMKAQLKVLSVGQKLQSAVSDELAGLLAVAAQGSGPVLVGPHRSLDGTPVRDRAVSSEA